MKIIKYFFEFLFIITFFFIFRIIGYKNASDLGKIIGENFGPLFRSNIKIEKNLENSNIGGSVKERKQIIKNMWGNYGRIFAEYMYIKKFRYNDLSKNIEIVGQSILEKIKSEKKPVIFISGHFNNFELMAMHLEKSGIDLAAIYRPLNNKFLNPIMERIRKKYICKKQIKKGLIGTRETINYLKNNNSIALMVDQRVGEGPKINLFNRPAQTTTIPAQLALRYNCKLVPISLKRTENVNFEMTVHQPYEISKTENEEQDVKNITLQINKIIEEMIIANPNQWLWSHNRWK